MDIEDFHVSMVPYSHENLEKTHTRGVWIFYRFSWKYETILPWKSSKNPYSAPQENVLPIPLPLPPTPYPYLIPLPLPPTPSPTPTPYPLPLSLSLSQFREIWGLRQWSRNKNIIFNIASIVNHDSHFVLQNTLKIFSSTLNMLSLHSHVLLPCSGIT